MAASVVWALLVVAAWAASHADPAAWQVSPWAGRFDGVPMRSLGMHPHPTTGEAFEAFIKADPPAGGAWAVTFVENRRGRLVVLGQSIDPADAVGVAGADPVEWEFLPDLREPRRPRTIVRAAYGDLIGRHEAGPASARDPSANPRSSAERVGFGWYQRTWPSSPARVTAWEPWGEWRVRRMDGPTGGPMPEVWHAMLPHWFLLLIALPLPAVAFARWRRTRGRRRRGECLACGYDLRAAVDGRCPECGRAAT